MDVANAIDPANTANHCKCTHDSTPASSSVHKIAPNDTNEPSIFFTQPQQPARLTSAPVSTGTSSPVVDSASGASVGGGVDIALVT
jgi:hypothetical protein